MLAGYLLQTIEQHSDRLTDALVADLTTNDRTPSYRGLQVDALRERIRGVYRHLFDWLGSRSETRIATTFEALGRQRFDEQIPLEELVLALILSKQHLRDTINRAGEIGTAIELHYVSDLQAMIGLFFDRAVHATVTGYEQARRQPPAERQQWAKFGIKTTEGIKVSAHLGGWLP